MSCEIMVIAVNRLHIDYVAAEKADRLRGELLSFGFGLDIGKHATDDRQFRLTFRGRFSEQRSDKSHLGFQVEAILTGLVKVHDTVAEDKIQAAAELSGVNILYGTMRGIILNSTGAFPSGPLLLRSFTAKQILESVAGKLLLEQHPELEAEEVKQEPEPTKTRIRKRHSPSQEGIPAAQRVFGKVQEKAGPKAKSGRR